MKFKNNQFARSLTMTSGGLAIGYTATTPTETAADGNIRITDAGLAYIRVAGEWEEFGNNADLFHASEDREFEGKLNEATTLAFNDTFLIEDESETPPGLKAYLTYETMAKYLGDPWNIECGNFDYDTIDFDAGTGMNDYAQYDMGGLA